MPCHLHDPFLNQCHATYKYFATATKEPDLESEDPDPNLIGKDAILHLVTQVEAKTAKVENLTWPYVAKCVAFGFLLEEKDRKRVSALSKDASADTPASAAASSSSSAGSSGGAASIPGGKKGDNTKSLVASLFKKKSFKA